MLCWRSVDAVLTLIFRWSDIEIDDIAYKVVLAMVPDRHFGSGSGSQPNRCEIGGPGRPYTRTAHSGTVPW